MMMLNTDSDDLDKIPVGDDDEKAVTLVKPLSVDQPLLMSFDKGGAKRAPAQWRNVQSLINL